MLCSARDGEGVPVVSGKKCTAFVAIKDDVVNAGGVWVDEAVVNDSNIITARTPADLTPWCHAIISAVETGK
jgi:protease I